MKYLTLDPITGDINWVNDKGQRDNRKTRKKQIHVVLRRLTEVLFL